jgi:diaminopimelate dehydrogenase
MCLVLGVKRSAKITNINNFYYFCPLNIFDMKRIRAAIVGYGNVGRFALEALEAAPDFEVAGIVRRNGSLDKPLELSQYEVVKDIQELKNVDVAILACPTRSCPEYAKKILPLGINTVDSFDIHSSIADYRRELMPLNKQTNTVSVIAAGWDPGSDSIVRTLMQGLAPKGLSYTNFGPGMSMGHSVCVRGKKGVKNALSVTIPLGEGIHRRMVYVELEEGATLEQVTADIKADPYFASDETHVFQVDSVDAVRDMGHGVNMVRKGVSGKTQNQRFEFNMSINNPALTGQVLVNVARASMRLQPGCYTMVEIPVIDMLPGDREEWIPRLV